MKRACYSLFFLVLIAFNTIGYYGFLLLTKEHLALESIHQIDDNSSQLSGNLILRIPMDLPYSSDWNVYQRVNGEIIYDGQVYRLVKQKIYKDNLYIVCIRDQKSSEANATMNDFTRTFSDQQAEHRDSGFKIINSFAKYYVLLSHTVNSANNYWQTEFNFVDFCELYSFTNYSSIFHPPQA